MPGISKKNTFIYRNGLTLFFLALFIITLAAQIFTGWKENNKDIQEQGGTALSLYSYVGSGHFFSATFENFQSEFLQMGLYVLATVSLRQIGSAESKSLDGKEEVDRDPVASSAAPWPVKKGGFILAIYQRSLFICFLILFLLSWMGHLYGSWTDYNDQQLRMHKTNRRLAYLFRRACFLV